jgi:uncharacterized linocin/CFP29 family protein
MDFRHTSYSNVRLLNKIHEVKRKIPKTNLPGRRGAVVSSPYAEEEIVAMGRKIESRQGKCRVVAF